VEETRKAEHRTRFELVREALRTYIELSRRFPESEATPAEIRALARAQREFERGETVSLSDYVNEISRRTRKPGKKTTGPTARLGPVASGRRTSANGQPPVRRRCPAS
jgi:hypothetical protein